MKGATAVRFLTNVVGTRALIAASQQAKVKRFVLVSSLGVYSATGVPSGGTLDENVPLDPKPHLRDPYSHSKIAEEKVAWDAHLRRRAAAGGHPSWCHLWSGPRLDHRPTGRAWPTSC